MSRRQSRVSVDTRQNDTLLEFENFKKKFLLANKHITKLNSTLSVRIEELNAQISTLYVENLRLRASEIALASQLKRERERSRKVIADAEAATHSLMKHFGLLRKSFNVPHGRSSTPDSPPPLRPQRPVINPNGSPPANRIARPPTFPGITEDDETNLSSPEDVDADEDHVASPSPIRRRKSKPRPSSSRLPVPSRATPPPEAQAPEMDLEDQIAKPGKRKPTRRQSGLLTTVSITTVSSNGFSTEVLPPRPPSPAFGSPLRREVGLAEELEETRAVNEGLEVRVDDDEMEVILQSVSKRIKKDKPRERERDEKDRSKNRDKDKEREESSDSSKAREKKEKKSRESEDALDSTGKSKLKDVTNSQRRSMLLSLDTNSDHDRQHTPDNDQPPSASTATTAMSVSTTRTFLTTPSTTPAPSLKHASTGPLLTPRASSPIPPSSELDPAAGGRERRVRKSINYAEPKLNTKMRKPDPPPGTTTMSKRTSLSTTNAATSTERTSSSRTLLDEPTSRRRSSSPPSPNSNDQEQEQDQDRDADRPPSPVVRRKKSRVYVPVVEDDDESDGTQADAEYVPPGGINAASRRRTAEGWVNVEGRRRSVQSSSKRVEGDESRRHSMAV